jgi:hypothetical protein
LGANDRLIAVAFGDDLLSGLLAVPEVRDGHLFFELTDQHLFTGDIQELPEVARAALNLLKMGTDFRGDIHGRRAGRTKRPLEQGERRG